jgi:hypothetical protein
MRRILVLAIFAAVCALQGCPYIEPVCAQQPQAVYAHDGAAVLPDPQITPGVADPALTKELLCSATFHTGAARNVPQSQKVRQCRAYGISQGCPGKAYELDHLISIELGGANADGNLWPQPVDAPGVIGYHTKDVVENRLHKLVCSGVLTLPDAQQCIARDWYACGQQWKILPAAR